MMKKVLLNSIVLGSVLFSTTACISGQSGYGSAISSQLAMVQNYRSNAENIELQGGSNDALRAARYRSGVRADIAGNRAAAQHSELGVVNHQLDTARKAQVYDHYAHMDRNREVRDDFGTVRNATGSVSGTVNNINRTIRGLDRLFK